MSLQRLLLPAGGVAVAMSFAHTTVYAAEKKKLYKPSELPLYGDPEPPMFELVEPEPCRYTQAVSTARKEIWSFLDSIQDNIDKVTDKWSVAKAHTNESLTYIQEDAGLLPRTALITVFGLGGVVAAYKGGFIRKLFYGTIGTLSGASLCYPNEAVEVSRVGWNFTVEQAEKGMKAIEVPQIPGFSSAKDEPEKEEQAVTAVTAVTAESSEPVTENKAKPVSKASLVDMGMSREEDNDMYTEHARQ